MALLFLIATGHLALNTFDIEMDATQKAIIGDGVFFNHFFARVVDNGALPDGKTAIGQAFFDFLNFVITMYSTICM